MNSDGNQADDQKYREPSIAPGAWNGSIILTNTPFPCKSTTGKRWVKLKLGLEWVLEHQAAAGFAVTLDLQKIAGLGIHITEVYAHDQCYLKGFFNAVESFRDGRDVDG